MVRVINQAAMPEASKIFCVIPAFNEEKTITEVVRGAAERVDRVVVVDDGSSDRTYDLAAAAGAAVLRHAINRGQGASLRTGNEYALSRGADVIVHFDADGQFIAREIDDMADPIKRGEADIVFGSRFLSKKSNMPWIKREVILRIARIVNRLFLGIRLTDPQSGFRAMSARTASAIPITQDGMAHCSEILARAFALNLRIKEVPVEVIYRDFGQRLGSGAGIIRDLLLAKLVK